MYGLELNYKSLYILESVHPKLASVVHEAREIGEVPFQVVEGYRSKEMQALMAEKGATGTFGDSPHCFGYAVSILGFYDDIPKTSTMVYEELATTMKYAAMNVGVGLKWGAAPHYPNICEWPDSLDFLMLDYLSACVNQDIIPHINPGYFELVLD